MWLNEKKGFRGVITVTAANSVFLKPVLTETFSDKSKSRHKSLRARFKSSISKSGLKSYFCHASVTLVKMSNSSCPLWFRHTSTERGPVSHTSTNDTVQPSWKEACFFSFASDIKYFRMFCSKQSNTSRCSPTQLTQNPTKTF